MLHFSARARRWEPTALFQHWWSAHKYAPLPDIFPLASISIFSSGVRTTRTSLRLSITFRHEMHVRCGGMRLCLTAILLATLLTVSARVRPLQTGYRRDLVELGNGAKLPAPGGLGGPPPPPGPLPFFAPLRFLPFDLLPPRPGMNMSRSSANLSSVAGR